LTGFIAAGLHFLRTRFNFGPAALLKIDRLSKGGNGPKAKYVSSEQAENDLDKYSQIYESQNGTPEQNMAKVLEMMGGIETIIDKDDIVIIKPNGQQIKHGMTNTNTIKQFVDQALRIGGFRGEVIICENHHHYNDNAAGWTTAFRNGDYNLNELVDYYHNQGVSNVTKYHWKDAGRVPNCRFTMANRGKIVLGPDEGDGYVWTDEEYSYQGKKVKMSYPIFTSAFSGVTIDFKNGAWKDGEYTGQPVKFINMSALRNHSNVGVTATIKNYLGVVDLTCGYHGIDPPAYYNFHYIAVDWPAIEIVRDSMKAFITRDFPEKQKLIRKIAQFVGPQNGALGGAVGHFMKTIRIADLNIITAEHAGHERRKSKPAHTKTVLASTDPVALDYYAGKYVLCPLGGKRARYNNPDNPRGTFRKYLDLCRTQGIGTLDETDMVLHKFDFNN